MRFKHYLSMFLLLLIFGCTASQVKDDESIKAQLLKRVNDFQGHLINKDVAKAELITLASKNEPGKGVVSRYIGTFKEGGHMASHTNIEYTVSHIEIRESKAKVKLKYMVTQKEGLKPEEATMFNFWQYDDGEWYFLFGGKPEFYKPLSWWK